jgi:hypothetical protein
VYSQFHSQLAHLQAEREKKIIQIEGMDREGKSFSNFGWYKDAHIDRNARIRRGG